MATLNTKSRKRMSQKSFALPGKHYPIPDKAHARNALARVAQNGSPTQQAKVRTAVKRKFPTINVGGTSKTSRRKKGGK